MNVCINGFQSLLSVFDSRSDYFGFEVSSPSASVAAIKFHPTRFSLFTNHPITEFISLHTDINNIRTTILYMNMEDQADVCQKQRRVNAKGIAPTETHQLIETWQSM